MGSRRNQPFSARRGPAATLLLVAAGVSACLVAAPRALADPPTFSSIPQDLIIEASQTEGAYVDFTLPTATDDNGAPEVNCDSNPGDWFPVGATTVTCTATDAVTDETSSASFQVRVLPKAQEQTASGAVTALFYYTKSTDSTGFTQYKNVSLTILRSGTIAYSGAVPPYPGESGASIYPAGYGQTRSVAVRDLDGDGEPEVLLDLYWGGAHCCFWSDVYRYDGSGYSVAHHFWGDLGYRLADVSGDGRPEFVSGDDRFAYAFSAFAFSLFPIQIWSYQSGQFTNVTRHYPARIRRDAARSWHYYLRLRRAHYETEGAAAAWAADEYLLHHQTLVWRRLKPLARAGRLQGNYGPVRFLRKLRLFLRHQDYG